MKKLILLVAAVLLLQSCMVRINVRKEASNVPDIECEQETDSVAATIYENM